MLYQAVLIDQERGHHRIGEGPSPSIAILKAFRQILKHELPVEREDDVNQVGVPELANFMRLVSIADEHLECPTGINEDVNETKIVVRIRRDHEVMYLPMGFVRPIF